VVKASVKASAFHKGLSMAILLELCLSCGLIPAPANCKHGKSRRKNAGDWVIGKMKLFRHLLG
jgi:hypothetical protein